MVCSSQFYLCPTRVIAYVFLAELFAGACNFNELRICTGIPDGWMPGSSRFRVTYICTRSTVWTLYEPHYRSVYRLSRLTSSDNANISFLSDYTVCSELLRTVCS